MSGSLDNVVLTAMPPYPWQTILWQQFCESVSKQRLAHALLISGVDGIGLGPFAHAMARYLLCLAPLEDIACGRCRACVLHGAGNHPDLRVIKKEENAAQIKVQQIRDCVEFVSKKSHFDAYKIVLLEDAESMNNNAANALLKSLEEPSGNTVFLLISNQPNFILPTIRSRCQKIIAPIPEIDSATQWLAENLGDDDGERVSHWLRQAGGAPLKAFEWVNGSYIHDQKVVFTGVLSLLEWQEGSVDVAGKWSTIHLADLFQIQIQLLDSLIRSRMNGEHLEQKAAAIFDRCYGVNVQILFRLRDKMQNKQETWQKNPNLNGKLLAEEMAMDWSALARLASASA